MTGVLGPARAFRVEMFVSTLDMEIASMESPARYELEALYRLGAAEALRWVRDGSKKPSEILRESALIAAANTEGITSQ